MKKLLIFASVFFFAGCAEYQLASSTKDIVVDEVSPSEYTVNFCGSAYMSRGDVEKYAYKRAAEVAVSKGCPYFLVLKSQDNSKLCDLNTGIKDEENRGWSLSSLVKPNLNLTVQCIAKGEAVPDKAINAEKYLQDIKVAKK